MEQLNQKIDEAKKQKCEQEKVISQNGDLAEVEFEEGATKKFRMSEAFTKGIVTLGNDNKKEEIDSIPLNKFEGNVKERTIMDVMGKPRDENICSNILAFYFNPKEEHELGNLVLKALIDILIERKMLTDYEYENIAIMRELTTLQGRRIDIVIKNNDYVIGIENKIDASLYNDLNDYSKTLDTMSPKAIKIVLSVNRVDTNYPKTGFINITYREFLNSLEETLQIYDEYTDKKWYLYLEDFIMNLSESHMEYRVRKNLMKENITLEHSEEYYNNEIINKVEEVKKIIVSKKTGRKPVKINNSNMDSTIYVVFDGYNMDARLTAKGWWIGIYVWKDSKMFNIKEFLNKNNISINHESARTSMDKIL